MDRNHAGDGCDDSDSGHEQQLCGDAQQREIGDAQDPTDVHCALEKSLLALEPVTAHGTCGVHSELTCEHLALQTNRAALGEYGPNPE